MVIAGSGRRRNPLHQVTERTGLTPGSYTWDVNGHLSSRTGVHLTDLNGNAAIAGAGAYEVLEDTTAPKLLAVLDGTDALYLLFDEPVEPAPGYDMTTAISIARQGQPVEGAATRLTATLLEWQPGGGVGGLVLGGTYTISSVHITDLAGNAATAGTTFTHLNTSDQMLLLAYAAPTDTQPEAASAYGLTTLFQGRTWHADLGMYFYRARWYLPELGEFAERDPLSYRDSPSLQQALGNSPSNRWDPHGKGNDFDYAPGGKYDPNGSWLGVPDPTPVVPENQGATSPDLGGALQSFLSDLYDIYQFGRATIYRNLSTVVDLVGKHLYGVEPEARRRSWGLQRRIGGGLPFAGAAAGDNLQIFYRGDFNFTGAIFTFDTGHDWDLVRRGEEPKMPLPGPLKNIPLYGPMGFQGVELGASVGTNYALNIMAKKNSELTGGELTTAWSGFFHDLSIGAVVPGIAVGPGVSGFRSKNFIGAAKSVGIGGGVSLAHEYYIRQIGPVHLSSPASAAHLFRLYSQGTHIKKAVRDLMKQFGLVK